MKSKTLVLFFSLLMSSFAHAQTWNELKGWRYIPQNEKFWNTYLEKMKTQEPLVAMEYFLDTAANKDVNNLEGAEFFIALADSLVRADFPQAAFGIYMHILKKHPGSALSQKALVEIESLAKTHDIDENELSRVINQGSFSEAPESTMDMLMYFTALDNMRRHLYRWAHRALRNISPESYWGQRMAYFKAIETYKSGKVDEADAELEKLSEADGLVAKLKYQIVLQRARIAFEKKKYAAAEKLYTSISFPVRLAGRVQLERAWNMFYQKDYAGTLGLLESMTSSSFRTANTPEQPILAMMTFREVCHYGKVAKVANDFSNKFKRTYEQIRRGAPLNENTAVMWLALQKPRNQQVASVVDAIQKESKRTQGFFSNRQNKASLFIANYYKNTPIELKKRQEYKMKPDLKEAADFFVQNWDRIKLVDYISKLDKFRIKQVFEERSYTALRADPTNYSKLFWPANGERWADEFKNYQLILSDRCQQTGPSRRRQ